MPADRSTFVFFVCIDDLHAYEKMNFRTEYGFSKKGKTRRAIELTLPQNRFLGNICSEKSLCSNAISILKVMHKYQLYATLNQSDNKFRTFTRNRYTNDQRSSHWPHSSSFDVRTSLSLLLLADASVPSAPYNTLSINQSPTSFARWASLFLGSKKSAHADFYFYLK